MKRVISCRSSSSCAAAAALAAPGERGLAESSADVDVADRECLVVLRRAGGGVATIDVDQKLLADPGATPGLLFSADGGGWESLAAQPSAEPATLGFARFMARFRATQSADFIAFARTTTEVRLFDHNRLRRRLRHLPRRRVERLRRRRGAGRMRRRWAGRHALVSRRLHGKTQHGAIVAGD